MSGGRTVRWDLQPGRATQPMPSRRRERPSHGTCQAAKVARQIDQLAGATAAAFTLHCSCDAFKCTSPPPFQEAAQDVAEGGPGVRPPPPRRPPPARASGLLPASCGRGSPVDVEVRLPTERSPNGPSSILCCCSQRGLQYERRRVQLSRLARVDSTPVGGGERFSTLLPEGRRVGLHLPYELRPPLLQLVQGGNAGCGSSVRRREK